MYIVWPPEGKYEDVDLCCLCITPVAGSKPATDKGFLCTVLPTSVVQGVKSVRALVYEVH
jgi:hypothetical protein